MSKHCSQLGFIIIGLIFFLTNATRLHAMEKNPVVTIKTELGDITLEIYLDKAPVTAANFLQYVHKHRFAGAEFYRVVKADNQPLSPIKIAVIQGGLNEENPTPNLPAISHETTAQTGIHHLDGTISMARDKPGSASSEFFICVGDQPELDFGGKRNPDGQGFAAFGKVTAGMETVHRIHQSPAKEQTLTPVIKISGITEIK